MTRNYKQHLGCLHFERQTVDNRLPFGVSLKSFGYIGGIKIERARIQHIIIPSGKGNLPKRFYFGKHTDLNIFIFLYQRNPSTIRIPNIYAKRVSRTLLATTLFTPKVG